MVDFSTTRHARLDGIDRAKGFAIILVVLGHIVHETPAGNDWYQQLRDCIYQFHMPFFVYLSGLVMFHSGAAWTAPADYGPLLRRRAIRCLVPFLLFGVLAVLVKVLAGPVVAVQHPIAATPLGIVRALTALLWDTHTSPASAVWYLYVLFAYYMVVPPLMWAVGGRIWLLLVLAVAIFFLPLPEYFYLDRCGHEFIFLILGGMASQHLPAYQHFLDRRSIPCIGLFALLLVLWPPPYHFSLSPLAPTLRPALIALLSLPALHTLMRRPGFNNSIMLIWLGHYSLVIYLLNTLIIGLAGVLMRHLMPWDGHWFLIVAPILLLAGTVGPVLLKIALLRRFKSLDMMTS
jgi:fucose 4-O-acetylase-like acetyltransferase